MPSPPPGVRERVLVILLFAVVLVTAARTAPSRADEVVPGTGAEAVLPVGAAVPGGTVAGWWVPLAGPLRVGRRFEPPPGPYAPGHRGVDLLGLPGVPVRAAHDGIVTFAGTVAGRGVVTVSHGTVRTTYEPLEVSVTRGEHVRGGEPIGRLLAGHAGCGGAACLHWGLLRGTEYLDPLSVLRPVPVRLLPLDREITLGGPGAGATGTWNGTAARSDTAAAPAGARTGPDTVRRTSTPAVPLSRAAIRTGVAPTPGPVDAGTPAGRTGSVPAAGPAAVVTVAAVGAGTAGWRLRRRQARGWARS